MSGRLNELNLAQACSFHAFRHQLSVMSTAGRQLNIFVSLSILGQHTYVCKLLGMFKGEVNTQSS